MAGDGGAAAFKARLKAVMPTIEAEINTKYRKLVWSIYSDLVNNSPQWSGNLASNWYISSGNYSEGNKWTPWNDPEKTPRIRGDTEITVPTLGREIGKLQNMSYKVHTRIFNPTPYGPEVEAGIGPPGHMLQEGNKLAEYGGVAMIGYVNQKYNLLGGKKNI